MYTHTQTNTHQLEAQLSHKTDVKLSCPRFNKRVFDNIMGLCVSKLTHVPCSSSAAMTLSVESHALNHTPAIRTLAENDAIIICDLIQHKISFGSLKSTLKTKSIIHRAVKESIEEVSSRVNINPSSINAERIKATILLAISYAASSNPFDRLTYY